MSKLLRIVAWLVGLLVVLIVVASIVLPMIVDPNDYKDDIATLVKEKTGRILTIDGDIGLSVFPWLALEIGPTSLSNADGFSNQPFASVSDVQVRIKLLPLLRKQVEMDTVVLDALDTVTLRPALVIALSAAAWDKPTTSGALTMTGPNDTSILTLCPSNSVELPAGF